MTEYEKFTQARIAATKKILNSAADKKLIIAGPGTGKSFLFREICKRNIQCEKPRNLALSFINELVDDLSKDLYGLAEVKTLHSFALTKFPPNIANMYLNLVEIIQRDIEVIKGQKVDFNSIFSNLINSEDELHFYSKRRKFYNHFSPHCSVYTLILKFENNETEIPQFDQILIDEFQDFNKLEARLISLLSKKSPIVIVGDDDQSLYDFKHARPQEIRHKHFSDDFCNFELPYCSRCTKVIIEAYAKIVQVAQNSGHLNGRVDKNYLYFPSVEKDRVSENNPKIVLKRGIYSNTIAYNIDKEIKELIDPHGSEIPTILIICPLRKQIEPLAESLRARGYENIDAIKNHEDNLVMDGFKLLLNDSKSNLGWRILFEHECIRLNTPERFEEVLKKSHHSVDPFMVLLSLEERKTIKKVTATLRKIREGKEVEDDSFETACTVLGYNPVLLTKELVRTSLTKESRKKNILKNLPIKIVTILGSKGLTRDISFLVNFDDRFLLNQKKKTNGINDSKICNFLVALTRARQRVSIYTTKKKVPTFVDWIPKSLIEDKSEK